MEGKIGRNSCSSVVAGKYWEELYYLSSVFAGKDWKEFFETPTAMERRRMGMVKKDFEEGNMKKMSSLPPISYISSNLPTSPGEAGLRLLHTVRVAEKVCGLSATTL